MGRSLLAFLLLGREERDDPAAPTLFFCRFWSSWLWWSGILLAFVVSLSLWGKALRLIRLGRWWNLWRASLGAILPGCLD